MPRKSRRAIQSKIAPSLAAAALMLTLDTASIQALPAATITVDGTTCTLADAITAANTDTATGGCTTGSGADVLEIQNSLSLTAVLPNITINGNSNTIQGNDTFRLFTVTASGDLTVNDATVSKGRSTSDGGGFHNSGTLTLNNATISGSANSTNFTPSGSDIVPTGALSTVLNSTLADNGGAMLTHALVSGSVAIDAAPTGASVNGIDQARCSPRL